MSFPIGAVGSLNAVGLAGNTIGAYNPIAPVIVPGASASGVGASSDTAASTSSGSGFASMLADSLQSLQAVQTRKDELAVKAATGDLNDVHDYTIAATEASLATQLTVAVRDKAVAAFQEIMRMQ